MKSKNNILTRYLKLIPDMLTVIALGCVINNLSLDSNPKSMLLGIFVSVVTLMKSIILFKEYISIFKDMLKPAVDTTE